MNFQTTTTHVVIKFNEKTKNGKESIDVLPISWTYYKKGKLFSRYPYEDEYHKLDDMCKLSVEPKTFWKSYEATLIKEASKYLPSQITIYILSIKIFFLIYVFIFSYNVFFLYFRKL